MTSYQSTCILNHTNTTRLRWRDRRWWKRHAHPKVETVYYDDNVHVDHIVWEHK